jgi:amino acid transporter
VPSPAGSTAVALPRVLGTWGFALTILNMVVGAGIFGIPASLSALLGRNALLAFLLCGVVVACVALCFAELGTRVPETGGFYVYAERAFGPFAGSVVGSLGWIANGAVGNASICALLVALWRPSLPWLASPVWAGVSVAALYFGLASLHVVGTRRGMQVAALLGVAKLVPLVLLILALPFIVRADALPGPPMPAAPDLGRATMLVFFAFMGTEAAMGVCGECREPRRTIPRGLLLATSGIALLYGGLQLGATSVLGDALAVTGERALPETASAVFGGWAGRLATITASVSILSVLVTDALCSPRVLFAMGRDGLVPRRFGMVHPRFGTPYVAVAVYAGICCALAVSGTFASLALLASSGTLLIYVAMALALLRLRATGTALAGPPFVAPGGPVLPLLVIAMVLALLASLSRRELFAAFGLVVVAAGGYVMARLGRRVA